MWRILGAVHPNIEASSKEKISRVVFELHELPTLICECECIMNSRSLTYLFEDTEL